MVNASAVTSEDKKSLTDWGVATTVQQSPISFGIIVEDINNYKPLKMGILWQNGNGGHDYVIRGYYQDTDHSKNDVYYTDPIDGSYNIKSYSSMLSNSSFYWYDSYYHNH